MIQLPSKIRTTLFNVSVEIEPFQLFSHEGDRLFVMVYQGSFVSGYPCFGRSSQAASDADTPYSLFSTGLTLYGPEPIWVATNKRASGFTPGLFIVHAIYSV